MHLRKQRATAAPATAATTHQQSFRCRGRFYLFCDKQTKTYRQKTNGKNLLFTFRLRASSPSAHSSRSPVSLAPFATKEKRTNEKKIWFAVCPFLRRVHEKDYLLLWPCSTVDACFYANVSSVFGIYKVINLFAIPIQAVFRLFAFFVARRSGAFFFFFLRPYVVLISIDYCYCDVISWFIARTDSRKRWSRDTQ